MRVLVIEDNTDDQKFIEKSLRPYVSEMIIRKNGESALNLLSEVDIVILDLNLGFEEGKSLLKKIKKRKKTLPVIIYTTSEDQFDIRECYSLGASCYVTKPFGLAETLEKLGNLGLFWKGVTYVE